MWFAVAFAVFMSVNGQLEPKHGPLAPPFETREACEDFLAEGIAAQGGATQQAYKDGKIVFFCVDVSLPEA